MSEVPGDGRPGDDPEPYVPSGVRRSTFTPPPADAEPPAFDDDALADALAAQVAPYTSPIPVTPPPTPVVAPAPAPEPPVFEAPVFDAPVIEPEPVAEPEPEAPSSGSSTLDAIERLENELRRRAEERSTSGSVEVPSVDEASPVVAVTPAAPEGPLFPAPPTYLRPAPPEEPVAYEPPAVSEPVPVEIPVPEPEPEPALEPEAHEPPTFSEPPPFVAPPPLVEPPAFTPPAPEFAAPEFPAPEFPPAAPEYAPEPPVFGLPPATPAIDLPPPGGGGPVDFAHLPPPIGLEPAALPPYDPSTADVALVPTGAPIDLPPPPGALAPPPADFEALLGRDVPELHPDDLGGEPIDEPGFEPPAPFAPPAFELEPDVVPDSAADDDDVVDDVDRVFGTGAIPVDSTGAVTVVAPPSQPIPTVRLGDDERGIVDEPAQHHPALAVEAAGPEPTPLDLRAGRAARLFWLWFAANSSVVSLSLGAVLFGLGMSLRQALVAILIGVALSFLPLGLVTLAGKWSGQPTMIVSRATFGLVGNVVPTVFAVVSRVFWGGALLWMLAAGVARVLADAGLDAGLGEQTWTLVGLAAGFALAFVVAIFGYGLLARLQLVLSIVTGILVVGLIVLTYPYLDISAAQGVPDGPWILLVSGVVLVFSFVGLAWVHSSADVARYQRPEGDGGSTMLWATFGATLPAFILLAWGAMLAASDPIIADGLATNPLHTIAALLPIWYPAPLIAAIALGLLSGVVLTIYSGGFALQALGIGLRRSGTTVIAGVLVLIAALALLFLVGDARGLIRDVATTIAVPIAAWAGIFATEMMIRRRRFHAESLLRRGGVYPAVRVVNLVGLVVITAIGFGLTAAELPWLDWQGYLLPFLGLPDGDALLTSDVGVLVALVLGILLPLVSAIPAIRRQEDASVD